VTALFPDHIDPHLTISLMIGGIRQALIGALTGEQTPRSGENSRVTFGPSWPEACA